MTSEQSGGRLGVRVSRMSLSNTSLYKPTNEVKHNIMLMFSDRRLNKYMFHFIGLCVISFLPLIFAGIALMFSTPSGAAKLAIYMVTLVIALVSIGFSARISYMRLCRAISKSDSPMSTKLDIVGSPPQTSRPGHPYSNDSGSSGSVPPMPQLPEKKLPPPPPYPSSIPESHTSSALMPTRAPPAPPLPTSSSHMAVPIHNSTGAGAESDDDEMHVYTFTAIPVPTHDRRSNPDAYVEKWVDTTARRAQVPAASSIDDLVETMLEKFTDSAGPSSHASKHTDSAGPSLHASKFIPLPSQPIPAAPVQRKPSARRKHDAHGYEDDEFLDSDSDNGSSVGVSPGNTRRNNGNAEKPVSVNLENIAAHIAQALSQPDAPRSTICGPSQALGHEDNAQIEVRMPVISPQRAEHVTAQTNRAVVHTREPPVLPPKPSQARMEIESMASSETYDY
ncbi:hypothetical protein GGH96_005768 [Coemansia sp. RSA 1972]|nr:hypothetical protein GGH96_005768 [Coemansia sp. RSA 1972]